MKRLIFWAFFFFATVNLLFATQAQEATRRFGIFVGSNNGGRDRVLLRFAVTDARSMLNVFNDMGGIANDDSILLVEPGIRDINRHIDIMREQVLRAQGTNRRTEIIFYYSGHSDEEGLLLNREMYTYRELRDRISSIPADMRIVILDSCASGAFTRLKGGERTMPFLVNSTFTAEGHAFLTSSSADESSQESDKIGASFFTHSLVAGLRGAADSVGDGRVTLNELYRFAYAETVARTELTIFGPQHPSYDIQMSGTGDLVLTDVNRTSAGILIDQNLTGRLSIRNSRDHLIAEFTKTTRPLELGLEPGLYRITLQQGSDLLSAELTLIDGQRTLLTRDNFTRINAEPTRRRGGDVTDSFSGVPLYTFFFNVVYEPFPFPLIGFVNFAIGNHDIFQAGFVNWNTKSFTGMQAGFINTTGEDFSGFQAGFVNTVAGNTRGFQSAFMNTTVGETTGMQAGFVNTTIKEVTGAQFGFVNIAVQGIKGFQFGFVNYADSIESGIPVGFLSIVRKGGYRAIEYSFTEFHTYNLGFKIGLDKFYSTFIVACRQTNNFSRSNIAFGFGTGSILPIGSLFFFNPELNFLSSLTWEEGSINFSSLVPHFGINIGKFSIAAGPSVTWVRTYNTESINKMLDKIPVDLDINIRNAEMPKPLFSLYSHDFNDYNRLVIGARIAARYRF